MRMRSARVLSVTLAS